MMTAAMRVCCVIVTTALFLGLESDLSAVFRVGAVQEPLIEYVRLFAGPTALDCGQHRFPIAQNELKQSVACGLAASGRREAFLAVVDNGQTQTGLLGTVEGVVYRFNYNTSFSIRRCPAPTATGREFTCLFPANETTAVQRPEEYIQQAVGAGAIDCGQHGVSATIEAVGQSVQCAASATARRQPFHTMKQRQGIDSLVYEGLLARSNGPVLRFTFDSAPCGGPGCFGSFTVALCLVPGVSDQPYLQFACAR
jgi:hypothetical protein